MANIIFMNQVAGNDYLNAQEAQSALTISGTSGGGTSNGTVVTVTLNGHTYTGTVSGNNGPWSVTIPLTDVQALTNGGSYTVTATAPGATSATPQTLIVDETAPSATATVTTLSADTGNSSTDFITNTASQTVSGTYTGTLGSGETIQVSANGGATWVNATASGGTWSASGVTLTSGNGTLSVRTVDTAGNTATGTSHSYTLDTAAAAPTLALASDTGSSSTDHITSNGQVNVSGLESSATWQYSTDGGTNWTTGTGTSFTLTGDGDKSVIVRQTDVAGNTSSNSSTLTFTIDTTPPTAIGTVTTLSADTGSSSTDFITNTASQTVSGTYSGTLGTGETIQVSADGGTTWVTATVNSGNHTWSASSVTLTSTGTTLSVR